MLISFIVPVYNAGEYLKPCVRSILDQSDRDVELLLIDDGSTDGSPSLCDGFAGEDPRVRVFHKENGGVHTARNLGLQQAKGEYVMFVDADDWIDTDTARLAKSILEDTPLDILRCSYVREYQDRSLEKKNTFVMQQLCTGENCRKVFRQTMGLVKQELAHPENFNFLASTWTCIFRKALLTENGVEFESRDAIGSFEDGLFNLKVLAVAKSFLYIDKHLYHYRKTNEGACTAGYRKDYLNKQLLLFERLREIAEQNGDEFMEAYYNRISFSVLELSLNAVRANASWLFHYREILQILRSPKHKQALKKLQLQYFDIKWKLYFLWAKCGFALPLFLMTKFINAYKKRG